MNDIEVLTRDLAFFGDAHRLGEYSQYAHKVACVAAKGNKKIAAAVNTVRNLANNVSFGEATYHAEYNVLRMLTKTDRVTLYIARLGKNYPNLPSRPCNRCMEAIRESGIREIVYLNRHLKVVKEILYDCCR